MCAAVTQLDNSLLITYYDFHMQILSIWSEQSVFILTSGCGCSGPGGPVLRS